MRVSVMSPVSSSRVARRVSGAAKPSPTTGDMVVEASSDNNTTGLQRPGDLRAETSVVETLSEDSRRVIRALESDLYADLIAVATAFYAADPKGAEETAEASGK